MSIRKKTKQDYFAQIPNKILNDDSISWKAKGLLCYLLSKPENWRSNYLDIMKHSPRKENGKYTDGEISLRTIMKELVSNGYAKKEVIVDKDRNRVKGSCYVVTDTKNEF